MKLDVWEATAADLVRAVRGRRSCAELSRRLGYRSNIVRRWEAGECWPTAAAFLAACARVQPATRGLFTQFFRRAPDWADASKPFTPASIARFLTELRGKTPIGMLAQRSGVNRYTLGRWLRGSAQPKLPEFLCLVEAASRRMLDLLAGLTDPARMPTVADAWRTLCRAREVAYESPWSQAVLRALELEAYRSTPAASATAWISERLGIDRSAVQRGLDALAASGQIRKLRGKWRVGRVVAVDTSADASRARALKLAWARVAVERCAAGAPGSYGYSVFAISRHDMHRLRALQLQYARAMQMLIAESERSECVGLYCAHLIDLSVVGNAFG
jgi:transcriptional regulator with XRE-family HTH domain